MSTTVVSGTITDLDSQPWSNGNYLIQFIPGGQGSNVAGASFTQLFTGNLDGSGAFSVTLTDTSTISPAGGRWLFTFVSNTSAKGGDYGPVAITGGSVNISTAASAAMPVPRVGGQVLPHAYSTVEMLTPPAPGALFFNVTSNVVEQWNGSTWSPITGTSTSVVLPGATSGAITLIATAIAGSNTATFPANTGTVAETNLDNHWSADQTFQGVTVQNALVVDGALTGASLTIPGSSSGSVQLVVPAAAGSSTATLPANTGTIAELNFAQTWSAAQTFNAGDLLLNPGPLTLASTASAARTATFPDNTGTVAELNLAQTWTAAQSFGTMSSTAATLTGSTINGLHVTTTTGTLTISNGKTLGASNSLTFTGTDGTSFAFPSGSDSVGCLGTANTWTAAQTFSGGISFATMILSGATPATSGSQVGFGNTAGAPNGAPGQAVTCNAAGAAGPASPTVVTNFLKITIGGTAYWIYLAQ